MFCLFQIENCDVQENIVECDGENEGWVETHHFDSSLFSLSEQISDLSFRVSTSNTSTQLFL